MTRFWVGGSGTWDASDTTHWSESSGGSGGASVPTVEDDVVFDENSHSTNYTVTPTFGSELFCRDFTLTNPSSGTVTFQSVNLTIAGSALFGPGVSVTSTGHFFFSGAGTLQTNGLGFLCDVAIDGGSISLVDALTISGATKELTVLSGLLDMAGQNVTCPTFSGISGQLVQSGVLTLTKTSSIVYDAQSDFTLIDLGGKMVIPASSSDKTLQGSGASFGCVEIATGLAGTVTFLGSSHTISRITATGGLAKMILFDPGSTTTFTSSPAIPSGTVGNLLTFRAATGTATLKFTNGRVNADYLSLTNLVADGIIPAYAGANSTDGGGTTGWVFSASPAASVVPHYLLMT